MLAKRPLALKVPILVILAAVIALGLFLIFSLYNQEIIPQHFITHSEGAGTVFFEFDDEGNKIELSTEYGHEGLYYRLIGSSFLDDARNQYSDGATGLEPGWHRIGYSHVLTGQLSHATLDVFLLDGIAYIIMLDDHVLYSDFLNPDEALGTGFLDDFMAGRAVRDLPMGIAVYLPPDYDGMTLTIVEFITSEHAVWWHPANPYISVFEAQWLSGIMAFVPSGMMAGAAAVILIILTVLFVRQMFSGKRAYWLTLLPILYAFVMMISMSTYTSFHLAENLPSYKINELISRLYFYSSGSLLVVFLSFKMKHPVRLALVAAAIMYFALTSGLLVNQLLRGEVLFLETLPLLGILGSAILLSAIVMMIWEGRDNQYFRHSKWVILIILVFYALISLLLRFTDYSLFIELCNPFIAILAPNFYPLNSVLSLLMLLMATILSIEEFTTELMERHTRMTALELINRMKTEFMGNVSHELKTPLTVMSGYAQYSQKTLADMPDMVEVENRMKLITSEADRLALMVTQILDVTRIEEGQMAIDPRPTSLTTIIQRTVNTYYPVFAKNNNRLIIARGGEAPNVLCDEARVSQVLVNLISNAAKHTRDGDITISTEVGESYVAVTVADTGEGIAAERLPLLFERFRSYSGKDETNRAGRETGTGLGLFICKHIIDAHGGEIEVTSIEGEGTMVRFTLPTEK